MNKTTRITKQGIRYVLREIIYSTINLILLLIASGYLFWSNAWILFFIYISYQVLTFFILFKYNPNLLNARGKALHENTLSTDKILMILYNFCAFSAPIIAGFDVIRFKWSYMPFWTTFLGIGILIFSFIIATWAMTVNPFFEPSIRIQHDRNQKVISSGPYKLIRHPGYLAAIIGAPSYTLILGSWWAFVPIIFDIIIFIIRTSLEDRLLMTELPGYKEYAKKVKFRLIPYIW